MTDVVPAGIKTGKFGFSGIHNAVCEGSVEWIKFLIEPAGVPVEHPIKSLEGLHAHTPLLCAINWGNFPVVDYLLSKGADVNARNGNKSVFSSTIRATIDGKLDDPLTQVTRFIDLGTKPMFNDIMAAGCVLDELDDETDIWFIDVAEILLKAGKIKKKTFNESDKEGFDEWINRGRDNAPELTEQFLDLLEKYRLDIRTFVKG